MDVEAIRLALGGDPVTYVGFSYGTLIGLRYAERFPGSLRAMALDGIVDPQQTLGDQLTTTAASIDRSLAAVLAACDAECPIEGDALDGYRNLVETARREPLHTDDGREVAPNAVVLAGIAVTYDEGLRDTFYAAIAEGQRGLGNHIEQFAEGFVGEFSLAPTIAVYCGDLPHPTSADQVEDLAAGAARNATVAPGLAGGYVRAFALPCLRWPVQPPGALSAVTAAGSPPILVIGNTGDPVTPYEAARRVAGSLKRGRLLTYRGGGHTVYSKDACADAYIDSYLMDLALPPSGAACPG
jgi:pimeloyl-ACP methyl ester carboxylesterase